MQFNGLAREEEICELQSIIESYKTSTTSANTMYPSTNEAEEK